MSKEDRINDVVIYLAHQAIKGFVMGYRKSGTNLSLEEAAEKIKITHSMFHDTVPCIDITFPENIRKEQMK